MDSLYAIVFLKGHQYKVTTGSVLRINKLNLKKNTIFILNKILLIFYKKIYYFNDNFFLKRIFILCRVISDNFFKKFCIFKMKRRKHYMKKKKMKSVYSYILIEKFILNFIK